MGDTATDLAREFAALNAAMTKAHELLADLRAERRLLAEDLKVVDIARAQLRKDINDQCGALIEDCVRTQLEQLIPQMKQQHEFAVKRVDESFTRLQNLYLCGNGPDPEPIEDMVIDKIARIIIARRGL
jgi:rRNA-processing protein FCF1